MTLTNVRDRYSLVREVQKGTRPDFLFFWGHRPLANGEIGASCLSQWWPASFTVEGVQYATAEHFMMAEKARMFADHEVRASILTAGTPAQAKKLGRGVRRFDSEVWEAARFEIVVRGNMEKFSQNDPLKHFLLGTGTRILVEASPVDPIWGIGLAADDPAAATPERWNGLNLLGFALMEVRQSLSR
jgi:hypothetical protein